MGPSNRMNAKRETWQMFRSVIDDETARPRLLMFSSSSSSASESVYSSDELCICWMESMRSVVIIVAARRLMVGGMEPPVDLRLNSGKSGVQLFFLSSFLVSLVSDDLMCLLLCLLCVSLGFERYLLTRLTANFPGIFPLGILSRVYGCIFFSAASQHFRPHNRNRK